MKQLIASTLLLFIGAACQSGNRSNEALPWSAEQTNNMPELTADNSSLDAGVQPTSDLMDPQSAVDTTSDSVTQEEMVDPANEQQVLEPNHHRFSHNAIRWPVPSSGLQDGFFSPWWANGTRWFSTLDLTGDGIPDLIQTADINRENGFIWRSGTQAFWKVWVGTENGFSQTPTQWSVPESGLPDGFFNPYWSDGARWFGLLDMDGDGRLDLIQTANSEREGGFVWTDSNGSYWKVWRNEGLNFSQDFIRWQVPDSGLDDGFFALNWQHGSRWFSTLDLNGDARPDLIQSADSTRNGGFVFSDGEGSYWKVWLNVGDGFATTFIRWSVPENGLADGFFVTNWSLGERHFFSRDLNQDGLADLVQTADPEIDGGQVWRDEAGDYWRVWLGTGQGFEGRWQRWYVPASGLPDGFFAPWYANGQRYFSLVDVDGDGYPDLVQSADSTDTRGVVWHDDEGPYWKIWFGSSTGFNATFTRWGVPEIEKEDGFFALQYTQGTRWFATLDLDGNGRPDLIQTGDPDREGGHVQTDDDGQYWRVWLN